jgi:DAACS family dicarboxylate/amino acid:cation (Na+ or H+) symporter
MEKPPRRGPALHVLMLLGFLVGLGGGLAVNLTIGPDVAWVQWFTSSVTGPIGQIFLRLLFMLVLPLLFAALVVGVAEMGDLSALGRVGAKTLAMTVLLSSLAVGIGLVMVNWLQPGAGVDPATAQRLLADGSGAAQSILSSGPTGVDAGQFFIELIPTNVFASAAANQILPVMVFALLFGIGLVMAKSPATDALLAAITGLYDVMMKLITLVLWLAPIAIAALMFNLSALFGLDLLARLAAFVGVAVGAMALHMFVVFPLAVWIFGGLRPWTFFSRIRGPLLVAFSTASSNATLPVSLAAAETELKLPRRVSRFVLTIGATANQNGTALFEGVAVLFLAQFFGVELTLAQQGTVMMIAILGGIGTAGVPAGSLPVVALILAMVGVPPAGIGIIMGVDRFLDMCRTTLNVAGDLVIAVVASRGEKDEEAAA